MRKPTVENKYNLTFEDVKTLKVSSRHKMEYPILWRSNVIKAWCASGTTNASPKDKECGMYGEYLLTIFDNDKIDLKCVSYKRMSEYKFNVFFCPDDIEDEIDMELQEKLLERLNFLIDEGILVI